MSKNPIPQGKYKPAIRHADIVYTAGMTPRKEGVLVQTGGVIAELSPDFYTESVIQATENAVTAIQNMLENGEKIIQILTMTVYVNAAEDYTLHAKIGDIASNYLLSKLGETGIGARAAVGMASLPGNAPVEIQLTAAVG